MTLSIANHHASLPIAHQLYLPKAWATDTARRRKAHVPKTVRFMTKPQIALMQVTAALKAGVTAVDYAHVLKELADTHFANAKVIVLVQDNLNIHSKASLYEAFPAAEARRLVERFEWHYTPKHGSWLDLAESELGVLSSQCLDRRIPEKQILIEEVAAWQHDRNANHAKADWHFTTANARIKLKHLYPSI